MHLSCGLQMTVAAACHIGSAASPRFVRGLERFAASDLTTWSLPLSTCQKFATHPEQKAGENPCQQVARLSTRLVRDTYLT